MGKDVPIHTGTACHHTGTAEVSFLAQKKMLKTSMNLPGYLSGNGRIIL